MIPVTPFSNVALSFPAIVTRLQKEKKTDMRVVHTHAKEAISRLAASHRVEKRRDKLTMDDLQQSGFRYESANLHQVCTQREGHRLEKNKSFEC
jgi:hypothetical protein